MQLPSDGPVYESPLQAVISNSTNTANALFNVLTPAFDSTMLDEVRFGVWLDGAQQKAKPAFQFSDDGVNWSATPTGAGLYDATQGWKFQGAYGSVFDYSPKNFVRFGVLVANTTDTKNRTGQAKLSIQFKPVFGQTVSGSSKVNTKGSTTGTLFFPLTEVVPSASFNRVRRTLELATSCGDVSLQAGYQLTNTPDDETTWDTATALGTAVTSVGIDFGSTFTTLSGSSGTRGSGCW